MTCTLHMHAASTMKGLRPHACRPAGGLQTHAFRKYPTLSHQGETLPRLDKVDEALGVA
jgi:hypothetical protein